MTSPGAPIAAAARYSIEPSHIARKVSTVSAGSASAMRCHSRSSSIEPGSAGRAYSDCTRRSSTASAATKASSSLVSGACSPTGSKR